MWPLTADCVIRNRSAAAVKVSQRQTVTKVCVSRNMGFSPDRAEHRVSRCSLWQ
jgi:hypothetical protein